jgi:hypothetical protein
MADTTYNGWSNYETWAVSMYLDGNYTGSDTYEQAIETVRDALERSTFNVLSGQMNDRYEVSQALKDWVRGENENEDASLAADLLGAAFDAVNWYELADAWIQNLSEQTV